MTALKSKIELVIQSIVEPRARWKAMSKIKWRLFCPSLGCYASKVQPITGVASTPDKASAMLLDGRDNEEQKLAYYKAATGGREWVAELV